MKQANAIVMSNDNQVNNDPSLISIYKNMLANTSDLEADIASLNTFYIGVLGACNSLDVIIKNLNGCMSDTLSLIREYYRAYGDESQINHFNEKVDTTFHSCDQFFVSTSKTTYSR